MFYSLIVIAAIATAMVMRKRWQKLPEEEREKVSKQYILWGLIGVILALVATGKAHWLMGVLAALLALLSRLAQFVPFIPLFKKVFGETQAGQSHHAPVQHAMTRQDAADLLGIDVNSGPEEIRLAHKKLMQKIHPDRGGSDALAKQINQAKDILLA